MKFFVKLFWFSVSVSLMVFVGWFVSNLLSGFDSILSGLFNPLSLSVWFGVGFGIQGQGRVFV